MPKDNLLSGIQSIFCIGFGNVKVFGMECRFILNVKVMTFRNIL